MSCRSLLISRGWTRLSWLLVGLALAPGFGQRLHADVDASVDQAVWKMVYSVTDEQLASSTWLAGDDDGDGLKNGDELAAGTNPFDAKSNLAVSAAFPAGATTTTITVPTSWGKLYRLQSASDLTAAAWTDVSPAVQVSGDGTPKTLSVAQPTATVFYRVMAMDQDTDGDGLSDWAEHLTGFDPTNAHTHGAAADDRTALLADLVTENVISVTADKPSATQPADALTAATDTGTLTITRGGSLHFSAIKVPLQWSGTAVAGTDYALLPASVTFPAKVSSVTLTVVPLANPARRSAVAVTLAAVPGGGYTVGAGAASVVISPSGSANGTGLTAYYWNSTSALVGTYSPNLFSANPVLTRLETGVNFTYTAATSPGTGVNTTNFVARWVGQVQPQYSETYYFDTSTDDGVKLWVNGQPLIDGWKYQSADRIAAIALQAGVLYDIKMEYYQGTGSEKAILYWYSDSQVKQVIPTNRLYPDTTTVAPPSIVGAGTAYGFVGQPFTYTLGASGSGGTALTFARGTNSGPLPPGLTLNAASGVVSGTPTQAGGFQVAFTATNAAGIGAGAVNFQILNVGSGVTRELWTGLAGGTLADVPFNSAPGSVDYNLLTPEDNTAYANNTGERLRGYFVAPTTGNYYFWVAGSNAAELWISDDEEPVNLLRRASVAAPGTTSRNWTDSAQTNQRSPWLALVAGQSYYYEIRHNTGSAGASSNLALAYLLDAAGTATTPVVSAGTTGGNTTASTGLVPAYLSSRYTYPTATAAEGALYVTNLSPQGTAVSSANGSANLRMLPGNTQAVLHFNYGGLTSPRTAYHIHVAPDSTGSGPIIFDLDDVDKFHPDLISPDGGYLWNIVDSGAYTAAQIVAAIQQGRTYFNVHTVNFPNGEIRGFLNLVNGSQNAPTPVADPGYADDHASDAGAARFLNQAAYGAAPADLAAVKTSGYSSWINSQMALPATHLLPDVQAQTAALINTNLSGALFDNAWWRAAMLGQDQLRQRVAFALSEILVVSDSNSTISGRPDTLASYYDVLADNAFGNFRELLEAATLHPAMGYWLNMQGSQKGNLTTGYHPNENYGREIMQLFSVGLNRLWPDGSFVLDSTGSLVPTYNQGTITNGFARVFTGWTWHQALQANGQLPKSFSPAADWINPMTMVKGYHELGAKYLLNNVVLPPAVGYSLTTDVTAGSQADTTTVGYDTYCLNDLEKGLDNIFNNPSVGPYICRQLIQRLVESNPSPAYLQRVVQTFNDDGTAAHVRGNLGAVVRAILLDGEARSATLAVASTTSGKQREPLLRIAGPARTFLFGTNSGSYSQNGTAITTITTANPHKFSANDVVFLDFSVNNTGTPPVAPANNPTTGAYTVLSSPAPTANTFAVTAASLSNVTTASEAANTTTLTVPTSGPAAGEKVYLKFITSGFTDGVYTVVSQPTSSSFTVDVGGTAPTAAVTNIALIVPKGSGYDNLTKGTKDANGNVTTPSAVTIATNSNFNLSVGDSVWIVAGTSNQLKDAQWTVASVIDERHFTVTNAAAYTAETNVGITIYPLAAPTLTRSGNAGLPASKFDMGNTNGQLVQTPMDSVTVFNYFYPDYQFPGTLSANNVTTPEFQLTTDTNVVTLSNTINSTILTSGNTNGLSNFKSGSINLDLSAYMGSPYVSVSTQTTTSGTKVTAVTTTTVDATALVNKLSDVLTGGMMTQGAKDKIATFINNTTYFPPTVTVTGTTTAPPAAPSLPTISARDKIRAVVQQIIVSSEYAVQR